MMQVSVVYAPGQPTNLAVREHGHNVHCVLLGPCHDVSPEARLADPVHSQCLDCHGEAPPGKHYFSHDQGAQLRVKAAPCAQLKHNYTTAG